jgi:hypothetical protein
MRWKDCFLVRFALQSHYHCFNLCQLTLIIIMLWYVDILPAEVQIHRVQHITESVCSAAIILPVFELIVFSPDERYMQPNCSQPSSETTGKIRFVAVPSPGPDDGKCLLLLKQIASLCYFSPVCSVVQANLLMTEFS